MTVDTDRGSPDAPTAGPTGSTIGAIGRMFVPVGTAFRALFQPITDALNKLKLFQKIILLNLLVWLGLITGILYVNQHEEWLVTAKREALKVQGQLIAQAILTRLADAEENRPESDLYSETLPQPPLPLPKSSASTVAYPDTDFTISPDIVDPLLGPLLESTETRGCLWDPAGILISDSRRWSRRILRRSLPPIDSAKYPSVLDHFWNTFRRIWSPVEVERYVEHGPTDGMKYGVVKAALASGSSQPSVMEDETGKLIVGVAVPIKRQNELLGALFLTTKKGELDSLIEREKLVTLAFIGLAALSMLLMSFMLTTIIVGPTRKLAEAADHVRESLDARTEIPEFPGRDDEIGHLASAFRDMTSALLKRIDAGEKFAADVSHELKNPLTAMRSAAESLGKVRNEDDRKMLIDNIIRDADRLNRLITDISNATRFEAEMALTKPEEFDVYEVLTGVISMFDARCEKMKVVIELKHQPVPLGTAPFRISGHPNRIAQVFSNVIANALSFSPEDTTVTVHLTRIANRLRVDIEDEGPGIPDGALEKIFRRFYTDRDQAEAGQDEWGENSGLGLSISRDIVEAHRGQMWAENRIVPDGERVIGARFVIELASLPEEGRRTRNR